VTATTTKPGKIRLGRNYWRLWLASVISNLGDGISAIAFPWLASAVTRNGFLIALIAVAQRLPWLIFTLPAGVLTDRLDRRKIMVWMDVIRALAVTAVAFAVVAAQSELPSPDVLASGIVVATNWSIYSILVVSALFLGFAEVLRDNAAQTFLPAIVEPDKLEKANGNLWGAEMVMNSFVGPPVGSILLGVGFALPFFVDAGTFALAAGLVFLISGQFKAKRKAPVSEKVEWRGEMKEGFFWLWHHPLLRPLAITLGFLNGIGMMMWSTMVLFAQEDLDLGTGLLSGVLSPVADAFGFESVAALTFAILMMAGALGGILDRHPDRRAVERHHRVPASDDHPRRTARSRQLGLPVLRLGDDADRVRPRRARRRDRRRLRLAGHGPALAVLRRHRRVLPLVPLRGSEAHDRGDRRGA
jgi:MFS family permease